MAQRKYNCTIWTKEKPKTPDCVRYAIYGAEICPETKRHHWQTYIELKKPMRGTGVVKAYGLSSDTMWFKGEKIKNRNAARNYCKKDGKWFEIGKWIKGQGHRSDLDNFVTKLKEGSKLSEMMINEPTLYCKYRNGLKDIAHNIEKKHRKEFRKVKVVLLTGPTGTGKTRKGMKKCDYKITDLKWWDGYDGEKSILIDEYDNNVPITKLLNILDGYSLRLPVKGGFTYANWDTVYITTNLKLDELHPNAKKAHRKALMRRITKIKDTWPLRSSTCNIGGTTPLENRLACVDV